MIGPSSALEHGDVKFLWRLLAQIPAAEAVAGRPGEGEADIMNVFSLINDYIHAGEGEVAEALRPTYLDYLKQRTP